jgi:hypothetical protein
MIRPFVHSSPLSVAAASPSAHCRFPSRARTGAAAAAFAGFLLAVLFTAAPLRAQQVPAQPPAQAAANDAANGAAGARRALIGALQAACRQSPKAFAPYLLADSARAFNALPAARQITLLKRFSMTTVPGQPRALLDTRGRTVVQCNTPAETVTYGLSPAQVDHNVAFIPVQVSGSGTTQFGLVHQPDGWRLYSLGLLVINVPALIRQWERAELQANEQTAIADLVVLEQAIKTYRQAFEQWPNSLAQLGPAPPHEVSPDHAQLVPERLASGETDGYRFRFHLITGPKGDILGFDLGAVPQQYGRSGRRSFFLDSEGKLHAADKQGAPATAEDPVIGPPPSSSPSS